MSTPKEVLELAKKHQIKMVDLKFVDPFGTWQHFTVPISQLTEASFEEGFGFDGSSIRGWKAIEESDMLAIPDPTTAFIDPFSPVPTISLICSIAETGTRQAYKRDPRGIAKKAELFLQSTGIADIAYFGPEPEFFIFDNVQYEYTANRSFHYIESEEAFWNTGKEEMPNLGYKIRSKEGYLPVPPADILNELRTEMALTLMEIGIPVECHHHEVATAGQSEIDIKYAPLLKMADQVMIYKYVIKNVARKHGKTVTFMPKPLFGESGSGMHVHISLWKKDKPLFAGNAYAGLSEMALFFIGGILKHGKALCAICNPTTNSYKRLVPGYEAPVNLAYSARNRSAAIRIPMYSHLSRAKRIEYRPPDPSCNPYLAFAAILMAGIDGILNRIDPGEPMDKNMYELPPEELAKVPQVPTTLEEALKELEHDHEFLLRGDVFNRDFLEMYIKKKEIEAETLRIRPHPYEFYLYFDV